VIHHLDLRARHAAPTTNDTFPRFARRLVAVGTLLLSTACEPTGTSTPPPSAALEQVPSGVVTFSEHVAPLLFRSCAPCHRPGEAAPFPLLTYDDARAHAEQIVEVTSSRFMPPWLPEPGAVRFQGERVLTQVEVDTLAAWARGGAVEGDAAVLPPQPQFPTGWQLGEPDLIVEMPTAFTLAAEGPDIFRNFVLPIPVSRERYVRAVEFRPGNRKVVHHANMLVDRTGAARRRDDEDELPGFLTMALGGAQNPDGHFLGWTPGKVPVLGDEDTAWRLRPGTDLVVQLHLQPVGRPETIRARVGFFFSPRPPSRLPFLIKLSSKTIDIPAGKSDYTVSDEYLLPVAAELIGVYPHAHYLGNEITGTATLPDGTEKTLLEIKDWDFNWQDDYTYAKRVSLPKGTRLAMVIRYDNSASNPRNPNRPPRRVLYGFDSADEMGFLMLQVLPHTPADRTTLEKHFAPKEHFSSIAGYEKVLKVLPDAYEKHNTLGLLYAQAGRFGDARRCFETALRVRPSYASAQYNLGVTLQSQRDVGGAIDAFRKALELKPSFSEARMNLGTSLASQRRFEEASKHFVQVVAERPDFADAHFNAGLSFRLLGQTEAAIGYFQRALELQPDFDAARQFLHDLRAPPRKP
jgi:tetratricopeptide (TPR) repeat protein